MSLESQRPALERARENYWRWLSSAHRGPHSRRTAERNAAFFLPLLKPGMRLLDGGCGPGSITVGLAAAVSPGPVVGVDVDGEALEFAHVFSANAGASNIGFEQHHLRALPYDDANFDAVFMHFVLQHVDEPDRVLDEAFRVLKPGGVIGVADADFDGALIWPNDPLLRRSTEILIAVRSEGDPRIGKQIPGLLAEAGFTKVSAAAVANSDGDAASNALSGAFWSQYFAAEPFIAYVEVKGISNADEMRSISEAWLRWAGTPGAFAARWGVQATAMKP